MTKKRVAIKASALTFPKVVKRKRELLLVLDDGRQYEIPNDTIKTMGLLHHLASKTWASRRFLYYAIGRIAEARGWKIHPF